MTIELHNFGPIKYFKFDLEKDLHAIFGKNNIGKSYALSAVYLILKVLKEFNGETLKNNSFGRFRMIGRYPVEDFEEKILKKITISETETTITQEVETEIKKNLEAYFLDNFNQIFQNSFAFEHLQNKLSNERLKITINSDASILTLILNKSTQSFEIDRLTINDSIVVKKINVTRYIKFTKDSSILYYNSKTKVINNVETLLFVYVRIVLLKDEVGNIYFLPASRSGLYNALSTFGAIMAELSQSRTLLRSKIELPNISEPVSDYFLNLSSIKNIKGSTGFTDLAKDIESQILQGKISFNSKTKKISYQPDNLGIELDLSVTSSMISEIAPIVAHLKFILSKKDPRKGKSLLFIEEPEAHLHPEIQVKLIEFFVRLIDQNVKVVMTSHSNYIFNKLSNLIIGKKVDANRLSISLMEMGKEGSEAKKGAMEVDEYGIEDQNFADIAEQLYEERMHLIDALNQTVS